MKNKIEILHKQKKTYNDTMSPSVVAASNGSEAFLPSSVPLIKKKGIKEGLISKKVKRTACITRCNMSEIAKMPIVYRYFI